MELRVVKTDNTISELSSYRIIEQIGHNAYGGRRTYLVEKDAQKFVLKEFTFLSGGDWSEYKAFEKEGRILQQLNHPAIPTYVTFFHTDSSLCLIYEYIEADPLSAIADWSASAVYHLAISILDILVYLQSLNPPVFHRDLKPENILMDPNGQVYLVDFGFAKLATAAESIAASSIVVGTTGYMPPEQLLSKSLSCRSDLYSLGATLIALLTQTPSNQINTLVKGLFQFRFRGQLKTPVSDEFLDWIERMVCPNETERYSSARAALESLKRIEPLPSPKAKAVEIKQVDHTNLLGTLGGVAAVVVLTVAAFTLFKNLQVQLPHLEGKAENLTQLIFRFFNVSSYLAISTTLLWGFIDLLTNRADRFQQWVTALVFWMMLRVLSSVMETLVFSNL